MFQVQNLNNIMAFPLENVLKSELRDSRLVSRLHLIINVSNTNKLLLKEKWECTYLLLTISQFSFMNFNCQAL